MKNMEKREQKNRDPDQQWDNDIAQFCSDMTKAIFDTAKKHSDPFFVMCIQNNLVGLNKVLQRYFEEN